MNDTVAARQRSLLNESVEEPVFGLAIECGRLFEKHLDFEVPAESNDTRRLIEEYQRLFWRWAEYVGVFAAGKASLDWRLRRNKMYQEQFLLALDMLKANLHQLLPPDMRSVTSAESDSSDDSDAYPAACDGVEESISQLNSLGMTIRQPVTSRLDSKVKEFSTKRTVQLNDFEMLASLALERLYPDAVSSLQQRLVKHMVGIHARLLYWKSHENKLSAQREGGQRSRAQKEPEHPQTRATAIDQYPLLHSVTEEKNKNRHTISDTEATTLPSQYPTSAQRRDADSDVKGTRNRKASTVMTSNVNFPSPPTEEDGHKCWYCRKAHSADKYTNDRWWRSHVNGDLLPYICLSDYCLGPKLFSSSGEWARHMTSQHGNDWALNTHESSVWRCEPIGRSHSNAGPVRTDEDTISNYPPNACPLCYMTLATESTSTLESASTKISNNSDSPSENNSGAVNAGAKVRFAGIAEAVIYGETEDKPIQHQTCPDDTHLNINRALSSHIAEHLQRIALLTLRLKPDATDNDNVIEFDSDNPAADESTLARTTSTVKLLMIEPSESERGFASDGIENQSQSGPDSELLLPTRVKEALVQCPYDADLRFLPNDALNDIVTAENIEIYIETSDDPTLRDRCSDIIEFVCGKPDRDASGIFAVLLLIESPHLIVDFMEENINDFDLPLWRRGNETKYIAGYYLDKKLGDTFIPIRLFDKWGSVQRFAFFKHQWWVKLPIFQEHNGNSLDSHPILRLHNSTILPWTEQKPIYHKNSEVVRISIHDAHHNFQARENEAFAIKSLKSGAVAFRFEVKALMKIKRRKHLVKLLTTFEHQNQYHFVFRWAEGGNLLDMWQKHTREPKIDHNLVCWFVEQCHGLAHGLDGIHETRLSRREVDDILGSSSPASSTQLAPQTQYPTTNQVFAHENLLEDRDCGRHGDIKPENILWFSQDQNRFGHGELKISDFGLTTFHSMLTTKESPRGIAVTHTYMAPEYDVNEDLSRPFDIWSLGCTYLEFITWMLLGADGLEEFTKTRLKETGSNPNFLSDNFYKIIREGKEKRAEMKDSVERWIDELMRKSSCSSFLEDFLDYIRNSMMVVDKSKRDGIRQVTRWLETKCEVCRRSKTYSLASKVPAFQESQKGTGNSKRKRSSDDSH